MGGGYIHCGGFLGNDKSGSAISGLVAALPQYVSTAVRTDFENSIIDPLRAALDDCQDHILIDPSTAERLIPGLQGFIDRVGRDLGFPEPWDAPGKDKEAGLDQTEAKWGKGKGWQYYCANDLLEACRMSVQCREPICVSFD